MDIGLLGAALILSAWVYETYRALEKGDKFTIKFVLIYIAGSAILLYHSYLIGDLTFMILNGAILVMTLIELELALRQWHKPKRRPSASR